MTGRRFSLAAKALRELGPRQLWDYARYRVWLRLGILRAQTGSPKPAPGGDPVNFAPDPIFPLPDRDQILNLLGEDGVANLRSHAEEIVNGRVRLFGGDPVSLELEPSLPLAHWTQYELGKATSTPSDYKKIWEPGRFGWAYTLARAYYLTNEEAYADAFWLFTERFLQANPAYLGPHWVSAQEVALRLVAFAFCYQIFRSSPHTTTQRSTRLAQAITVHAQRISPSLAYARSQNNNHLINEAAGLYTAGIVLPMHPKARRWREIGWRWFNHALQSQIADNGTYIQHSANYHRLILQTALWIDILAGHAGQPLPVETRNRLAAATRWMLVLLDKTSGHLPNLGPNDGAYIFPLSGCPFEDYRPALDAASSAFLGYTPFETAAWSEMRHWLCRLPPKIGQGVPPSKQTEVTHDQPPHQLDSPRHPSWAYLRVANFHSRPGHADQLHLDLWWRGQNLAQDAGSYLYNDPPPWDNALARTQAHNTITVDGLDQMTQAGRFLWLDWAQARLIEHASDTSPSWERLVAQHDGYRRLGVVHQRSVTCFQGGRWLVEDLLLSKSDGIQSSSPHLARLHWLLPDWPWEFDAAAQESRLTLSSPFGPVELNIQWVCEALPIDPATTTLVRAGEMLLGSGQAAPARGWTSHTYAHKIPALSFVMELRGRLPIRFISEWRLP